MNEQALESLIEKKLTGSSKEDRSKVSNSLSEPSVTYITGNGYIAGEASDFNPKYAIDEVRFWSFLESTQPEKLQKLKKSNDWKLRILERYDKLVKQYGQLEILKKGLELDGVKLIMMYPLPHSGVGFLVEENFKKNEFSVSRQIPYNASTNETIDMVIFINGLAISTIELKNPWTGQTARVNGQNQYKYERDKNQPLLQFARCLVHFTADTDEVYMTTKLNGKETVFLPFNKGNEKGKGNPPNPNGHKTSYLWEEILEKHSLAGLIEHFIRLDGKKSDKISTRTLYFPRYHQLDVVRKLITDISEYGIGKKYLVQHSAGSGKSNSITWLAYQLIEVYPQGTNTNRSKGFDIPLFDSVIVVTDRRLLNKQLGDNIKDFSEVKNIVRQVDSSADLKKSIESGKKIIITTLQKFPNIVDGMDNMSGKNFAIIIDEAHSSQGGVSSSKMNQALGINVEDEEEIEDYQDKILKIIEARKMKDNASYFAFTATPKESTLEKFGVKQNDGTFVEFHLYSMKQAIQEGFILDVLSNYTTYKSYYQIIKTIEDNPEFDKDKAQKKLRSYVEAKPETIKSKAKIMYDHFMREVVGKKRLKGHAKGMIVTKSIESAIRYYNSLKEILNENGNPFKIIIAFSGEKKVDGVTFTESGINKVSDADTSAKFDEPEYRLLIVANKYLTGFDQPKLCTMYIDKKLQGVLAVQALSRLNRSSSKYGKRTEDIFVLDFFNTTEDIKKSFDRFYTSTTLTGETDPNVLYDIKGHLDEYAVYEKFEVEEFNKKFFNKVDADKLSYLLDTSVERFDALEEEDSKADFKIKAKHFVKLYGQVSSIISFENVEWEMLFWYLKYLIPKLVIVDKNLDMINEILNDIDLSTYGMERTAIGVSIGLDDSDKTVDPLNQNPRGTHTNGEKEKLDEIINVFNMRFFEGWDETDEEKRITLLNFTKDVMYHSDFNEKVKMNSDEQNSNLAFTKIMDDVMSDFNNKNTRSYKGKVEFMKNYHDDKAFKHSLMETIKQMIQYL